MGITRLNHAVLYVRDAELSARFYEQVLGFVEVARLPFGSGMRTGIFLCTPGSANDHDLALFGIGEHLTASRAGSDQVGLYHLAWEVTTLRELAGYARRLAEAGALVGQSNHTTTKALYAADPDGIEFEISWIVPPALLHDDEAASLTIEPLDLDATIERFGADTPGRDTCVTRCCTGA